MSGYDGKYLPQEGEVTSCCFTGHRSDRLMTLSRFLKRCMTRGTEFMVDLIVRRGCRTFYTGLCNGYDLLAAQYVLAAKKEFPDIVLIGVEPYLDFQTGPLNPERELQARIRGACESIVTMSPEFIPDCYRMRNEYMVDHSDLVIAAWTGVRGGTANTVRYAESRGVPVWNVLQSAARDYLQGSSGDACLKQYRSGELYQNRRGGKL